jgi:hypothetical protein
MRLNEAAQRLGPSPDRIIHRWSTKHQFVEAVQICSPAFLRLNYLYVQITDLPDAAWIRVRSDILPSELSRAAGEWLTDGFIAFHLPTESLLSVDVEERGGISYIETTIIGEGFVGIRDCFNEYGPSPLSIADSSRDPNRN